MNAQKIQPLPRDVAAKIKSSTSITHLNGVILELAKNATDANARTVLVTVDYRRGGCVVEDDGDGIMPAEFEPEGGLGKAHRRLPFLTAYADCRYVENILRYWLWEKRLFFGVFVFACAVDDNLAPCPA